MTSPRRLDRQALYELVWSTPVMRAAHQFGISDVALAKLCRRQQVPLPPRGYWARKAAGQSVDRPPLLAYVPPPRRPTAAERAAVERKERDEERARALAEKFRHLPLVCFTTDVAGALGISVGRVAALLDDHAFPIAQLPFYGLLQRGGERGHPSRTARPCWSKLRVLEFLAKAEWDQGLDLELPSERVARTCRHCPVHCPAAQEHPYRQYLRNRWRGRAW